MGMFSEIHHTKSAKDLEKVLFNAKNDRRWGDCRLIAIAFAREEVYPIYLDHCKKADDKDLPNPEIVKIYE